MLCHILTRPFDPSRPKKASKGYGRVRDAFLRNVRGGWPPRRFPGKTLGMTSTLLIVIIAAAFRILPHPANMTPVAALALFAGSHFGNRRQALLVTFAVMLASDAILGFHETMPAVYGALAVVVLLGRSALGAGRDNWVRIGGASLAGSTVFFVLTNGAVWLSGAYGLTWQGLAACYAAAIPFFERSIAGDFIFTGALFGAWKYVLARAPTGEISRAG